MYICLKCTQFLKINAGNFLSVYAVLTPYSMVWDWRISRAGPMPFYWPSCSLPFSLLLISLFFHSMGWYCGAGVFGLIGCQSLSPGLALPAIF